DRAMRRQQFFRDAQQFAFGVIGISDEAALENVGGAGDLGQKRRDQAAGAAFRRGDLQAAAAGRAQQRFGGVKQGTGEGHSGTKWRKRMTPIPAIRPASMSSAITPRPPEILRSAQPTGQGFQMSNSRNRRKATAKAGREIPAGGANPPSGNKQKAQASHWPASSSMTHSDGSSRPVARTCSPQAAMPIASAIRLAISTAMPPP